ncbi:MAG: radical SAM protein [Candidatus Nitrohelix vancouverensis]|uniref:Radical SAM protein n=1 Tax=Candidatus Nitrohelix vancouverensis TaxID=2705534 RepID=A0A7T0C1F0_9BACT|nr:MAG: radical SAM protein [Candidatus Nitrohelix vancouverensis]
MDDKTRTQTRAVPQVPLKSLDTLWMQVGGTLCNLSCSHCFISCGPQNHSHAMMSLAQVRGYLEQAKQEGVQDYYITGGEVFINPEIFEILAAILEYGPLNVLTNATLITPAKARQLAGIRDAAEHPLQFRISMEHFDEAENDKVRGSGSYAKALTGLRNLAAEAFSPILTITRSWDEADDAVMETQFLEFLKTQNVPEPRIKVLPGFLLGRLEENERSYQEEERVTASCFENYDITQLQCATSRMATAKGVYVCPILVEEPSAKMGETIQDTLRPFPLAHSACYTCRVTGMTCKS